MFHSKFTQILMWGAMPTNKQSLNIMQCSIWQRVVHIDDEKIHKNINSRRHNICHWLKSAWSTWAMCIQCKLNYNRCHYIVLFWCRAQYLNCCVFTFLQTKDTSCLSYEWWHWQEIFIIHVKFILDIDLIDND
jgi:hypothetical protein